MESNIEEPLQYVPFSNFPRLIGWDNSIDMYIYDRTTIHGCLRNMHIYPRASDRRWNREFRKEEKKTELEQRQSRGDIPGEEVPPPAK